MGCAGKSGLIKLGRSLPVASGTEGCSLLIPQVPHAVQLPGSSPSLLSGQW